VDSTRISVTLELGLEGDALDGRAIDDAGVEHPFVGWIGLAGVIDELLRRAAEEPAGPPASAQSTSKTR
jgi:hypothetical protein